MIYLPDGGDCSSVGDCTRRYFDVYITFPIIVPSGAMMTLPCVLEESVLEQQGGIWSSNNVENPFAEHFKILIHYCSSDNFAGAY